MKDSTLETIALLTITLGLFIAFAFVLDFEPADAHFLDEDENNAFIQGKILENHFSNNSGWSYLKIDSCRIFEAYYEGEVLLEKDSEISVKGSLYDGTFTVEEFIS